MEGNKALAPELKTTWRTLAAEIKKSRKLKFEMFETAFSQTYQLLAEKAAEPCLDKDYVQLVAEAFLFANIKDDSLDSTCHAAFVLTERMLNSCAFRATAQAATLSSIYVVETREDLLLDFSNVNESIDKLKKIFDNAYWKAN